MIFLILLYLSFFSEPWNTLARPTDLRPQILPTNHLYSIFIREEETHFNTRSIYNILWSCLSTIFVCTWITVHPNIPAPGDSQWVVLRRRAAIMGCFLLAPEFVIMWAARQHYAARHFTKIYAINHPGWTRAHTFFLIMGGFTLHERGEPVRVLEAEELEKKLSKAGKIKWPTITKEEIADRSKADYLSKTIVLFQTTWFVGQCIARGAYGLTVTELELVTVAFASLTGVIYYFWWDKPLDVRCSIPVHLLEGPLGKIEEDLENKDTGTRIISPPEVSDQEIRERDEKAVMVIPNPLALPSTPIQVDTPIPDPVLTSIRSYFIPPPKVSDQEIPEGDVNVVINPNLLPKTSIQVDTSTSDPALTRIQRFQAFIRGACEEYGTFSGLGYVFIRFPLDRLFGALWDMTDCKNLGDKSLRVPTFYSPHNDDGDDDEAIAIALSACVATVFGAIHCIAWSFHFATLQERWMWRISAILVSGLPISIFAFACLLPASEQRKKSPGMKLFEFVTDFIVTAMFCLYLIARIILLILPFITLHALPPGAYVQLNWVSFLPHI